MLPIMLLLPNGAAGRGLDVAKDQPLFILAAAGTVGKPSPDGTLFGFMFMPDHWFPAIIVLGVPPQGRAGVLWKAPKAPLGLVGDVICLGGVHAGAGVLICLSWFSIKVAVRSLTGGLLIGATAAGVIGVWVWSRMFASC